MAKDKTIGERMARLRDRYAKNNVVRVQVWVPEINREDILNFATQLREKHLEASDND